MKKFFFQRIALASLITAIGISRLHAVEAVLLDDSYTMSARPNSVFGASKALSLKKDQNVYLKFGLGSLPAGTTSTKVASATLKIWVDKVTKPGAFDVFPVTGAWTEETMKFSTAPTLGTAEATGVTIDATHQRQFLLLDVTGLVKDWLDGSVVNNGIAFSAPANSLLNVRIPSKEDVATGHLPQLEINLLPGLEAPYVGSGSAATGLIAATNTGTGAGIEGNNTAATGTTASGVVGRASSTSNGVGPNAGVTGVLGVVTPTAPGGYSAGVRGVNNSTGVKGIGVIGYQGGSGWGVYGETPSGVGVFGLTTDNSAGSVGVRGETNSTNGIGVEAKYSGTGAGVALQVTNGAIRVAGTNKAAFVHTATPANKLDANGTDVDNPLCNGDPTCLLFVTQKLNPTGIVYNNSPIGVFYNTVRNKWEIFNQNNTAIPNNAQFNVLVIKQ